MLLPFWAAAILQEDGGAPMAVQRKSRISRRYFRRLDLD